MRILFLLAIFSLAVAQAGVILVSEPGLAPNGSVNLASLGGDWARFSSALVAVDGIPGLTVGITDAGNSLQRLTQGTSWSGNFASGEPLLWTDGQNGPITLTFSGPVMGTGMQIQPQFPGTFWVILEAFNSAGQSLGYVYRTDGFGSHAGDDSAIFVGILSDSTDIRSVTISLPVASGYTTSFAINGPLVRGASADVPEPGSALLLGAGGLGLLALARRRRSA